jgi:hypothetical protein
VERAASVGVRALEQVFGGLRVQLKTMGLKPQVDLRISEETAGIELRNSRIYSGRFPLHGAPKWGSLSAETAKERQGLEGTKEALRRRISLLPSILPATPQWVASFLIRYQAGKKDAHYPLPLRQLVGLACSTV